MWAAARARSTSLIARGISGKEEPSVITSLQKLYGGTAPRHHIRHAHSTLGKFTAGPGWLRHEHVQSCFASGQIRHGKTNVRTTLSTRFVVKAFKLRYHNPATILLIVYPS